MKKSTKIITLMVMLIALFATAQEAEMVNGHRVVRGERPHIDLSAVPADSYEPGVLTIKVRETVEDQIDQRHFQSTAKGYVETGVASFDAVNQIVQAQSYERGIDKMYEIPNIPDFKERHRAWGFHRVYEVRIPEGSDVIAAVKHYAALEDVEWAEPQYKKKMHESKWAPNDPSYGSQWGFKNNTNAGIDVRAEAAWDIETGNSSFTVCIVDDGIDYTHPDLAANMHPDIGYNFVAGSSAVVPGDHGTHVAGTVGAVSNNGIGVAGLAGGDGTPGTGIQLLSAQVFTATGGGGFALAIQYGADMGAAISQNSWGYTSAGVYEQSVLDAIDYFNNNGFAEGLQGGITIFASGNDGEGDTARYPGYYSGAMAVAAHDNAGRAAGFTNYGDYVEISAPGTSIYSTVVGGYANMQGTSMACPHVSGAAALIVSNTEGLLTNVELRQILKDSVWDIYSTETNGTYAGKLGTGALDASAALNEAQAYTGGVPRPESFTVTPASDSQMNLSWTRNEHNDNTLIAYVLEKGDIGTPENGVVYSVNDLIPGGGTVIYYGTGISYSHTGLFGGTGYSYKVWSRAMASRLDSQGELYAEGDYSTFRKVYEMTDAGDLPPVTNFVAQGYGNDVYLNWDKPRLDGLTVIGNDQGLHEGGIFLYHNFNFGQRMRVEGPGTIQSLIYMLSTDAETTPSSDVIIQHNAYDMGNNTIGAIGYSATKTITNSEYQWIEYDVSAENMTFTGDFLLSVRQALGSTENTAVVGNYGPSAPWDNWIDWDVSVTDWGDDDRYGWMIRAGVTYSKNPDEIVYIDGSMAKNLYTLESYDIYRDGVLIANIPDPDVLEYDDLGLGYGAYQYFVIANFSDPAGQSAGRSNLQGVTISPPTMPHSLVGGLQGSDVALSWQYPQILLRHCKEFSMGVGIGPEELSWAGAKWYEEDKLTYEGTTEIYQIEFWLGEFPPKAGTFTLEILGEGAAFSEQGAMLYSASFDPVAGQNIHTLTTPLVVPTGDIWIGYRGESQADGGSPMAPEIRYYWLGFDDGPQVRFKGGWIGFYDADLSEWYYSYNFGIDVNTAIWAYTQPVAKSTPLPVTGITKSRNAGEPHNVPKYSSVDVDIDQFETKQHLVGFSVYRDGTVVGTTGLYNREFLDSPPAGVYDYWVTANHGMPNQESLPSNVVEVDASSLNPPVMTVSVANINGQAEVGLTDTGSFTITNDGTEGCADLTYSFSFLYDGNAGTEIGYQTVTVHENDFTSFPGSNYTNDGWTAFDGGARARGNTQDVYTTSTLTSPQFNTDGITDLQISWLQAMSLLPDQTDSYARIEYNNGSGWTTVYNSANVVENGAQNEIIGVTGPTGQIRFTGYLYQTKVKGTVNAETWDIDDILVQGQGETTTVTPHSWMSAAPMSGTVARPNFDTVNWTMDSTAGSLAEGTYTGTFRITSNAEAARDIPMTFVVGGGDPPGPLDPPVVSVALVGGNAQLSWPAVTNATGYVIYGSTDPYGTFGWIANTADLQWDYTNVGTESKMFFHVTSTDGAKAAPMTIEVAKPAASTR